MRYSAARDFIDTSAARASSFFASNLVMRAFLYAANATRSYATALQSLQITLRTGTTKRTWHLP